MTKPFISRKNQKARLTFAEEHIVWSEEKWSRVHFSDESKFNLFGADGKSYGSRQTAERLNPKCVKKSVKVEEKCHGLGNVFGSRSWSSHTVTWQSECKCVSEPSSTTRGSFLAFITQSASKFRAGQ